MGCVGDGLACKEHQVSICAKDSRGPYNYDVVSNLIEAAKKAGCDFAWMFILITDRMRMLH